MNLNEDTITSNDLVRMYDLVKVGHAEMENYSDWPNIFTVSPYKKGALSFIAGYLQRKSKAV